MLFMGTSLGSCEIFVVEKGDLSFLINREQKKST